MIYRLHCNSLCITFLTSLSDTTTMSIPFPEQLSLCKAVLTDFKASFTPSAVVMSGRYCVSSTPKANTDPEPEDTKSVTSVTLPSGYKSYRCNPSLSLT